MRYAFEKFVAKERTIETANGSVPVVAAINEEIAKRIASALNQFEGVATPMIEAMPTPVLTLATRYIKTRGALEDIINTAKSGNEQDWKDLRALLRLA